MKKLFVFILAGAIVLAGYPAIAADRCTSYQTSAINSQKAVVATFQQKVANDTDKSKVATANLQKANAIATGLNAKVMASDKKISELLAKAAKNAKSNPSIARGYQSQADSEAKNLKSLQSSYIRAANDVASATKSVETASGWLKTSTYNLGLQLKKLNDLTSKCTR